MLRFSSSSLVKCILAGCSGSPPQCSTFSSVRYSTGLWDCPWCWCCVYGMQARHLFLLTRESGTTIGSRNNCYTPGEWKDQESPRLKTGGLALMLLGYSSLPFAIPSSPLQHHHSCKSVVSWRDHEGRHVLTKGMREGTYLADNVFMLSCWHASDRVVLLFVKCIYSILCVDYGSSKWRISCFNQLEHTVIFWN